MRIPHWGASGRQETSARQSGAAGLCGAATSSDGVAAGTRARPRAPPSCSSPSSPSGRRWAARPTTAHTARARVRPPRGASRRGVTAAGGCDTACRTGFRRRIRHETRDAAMDAAAPDTDRDTDRNMRPHTRRAPRHSHAPQRPPAYLASPESRESPVSRAQMAWTAAWTASRRSGCGFLAGKLVVRHIQRLGLYPRRAGCDAEAGNRPRGA